MSATQACAFTKRLPFGQIPITPPACAISRACSTEMRRVYGRSGPRDSEVCERMNGTALTWAACSTS